MPAPTTITLVVAPLFHFKLALQPLAVNVAFSVPQTVVLSGVIVGVVGVGKVLITTGVDELPSPHSFLQVAVYVPAVLTVKVLPVAPVLHTTTLAQPVAVKVTV